MDPLSLSFAANLIAVVGAANQVARRLEKIRSFRRAPDQLLQVINDISDIRIVLTTIQQICDELDVSAQEGSICAKLQELLLQTGKDFAYFNDLAQKIFPDTQNFKETQSKISWRFWIQERKDVQAHLTSLRNANRQIMDMLVILQASNIPRIRIRMADIAYQQDITRQTLSSIQSNVQELEHLTNHATQNMQPQLSDLEQRLQTTQTAIRTDLEVRSRRPLSSQNSDPTIRIGAILHQQQVCHDTCMCRCHNKTFLKTPNWLEQIIGALFVGYTAIPILSSTACNERRCIRSHRQLVTVSYYFPSWLMRRALILKYKWAPTDSYTISIKTPRIMPKNAPQILLSQEGMVHEMQKLFSQGLASPFDVNEDSGTSCLQYAVSYGKTEMCKLLLSQYADPYYSGNSTGDSCLGLLILAEVSGTINLSAIVSIKELFRDFMEDYEAELSATRNEMKLSILHQIVLGMVDIDLRAQLLATTSDIDTPCAQGKTPLHWAIIRSDLETIQVLLDFGANLNITTTYENQSVLYHAVRYGSIQTLYLLLERITASNILVDSEQASPENNQAHIKLIDQPDSYGYTPLLCAIYFKKIDHSLLLLEFHCAIHPAANVALPPLLLAIQCNTHEVLKYLLRKGVKTDVVDDDDHTNILHFAGGMGDFETISILLQHDGPLDVRVTDIDDYGNNPLQSFEKMRKVWVEEDEETRGICREAFVKLLNKANSYQLEL